MKMKMKIKKGDTVLIIAGKDKNKKGKVAKAMAKERKIIVEGMNLVLKHMRPRKAGEKGQRVKIAKPIDLSNVMFVCPKCNKAARIGNRVLADGSKARFCRKCGQEI